MNKKYRAKAIDLYSGIGGWTLGMKMSSVENVASYEWWSEANLTHNLNFGTDHEEVDIRKLSLEDLPEPGTVDFVLGSPPCTQFSYANRGGNGDIADGLKDIYKFLEVVNHLKPKYWAMENVPRVSKILKRELGIGGQLYRFRHLFTVNIIVNSADYGVPQSRKRMIAGDFPFELFNAYKAVTPTRTLKAVLDALKEDVVTDPIFGIELPASEVTDNYFEEPLSPEEERINREAKTYHPVYNKMSFPDQLTRPSRTVTATCTRVSRESIIVKDERNPGKYRRLNIRERALIQSFPITYQFHGKAFSSRFKMIGNAIPPLLTYYIIQSMLETPVEELKAPSEVEYKHKPASIPAPVKMDNAGRKYPAKRSFKFAIPHLRFGSGVRFDLANSFKEGKAKWEIEFFYGNSKKIKRLPLNEEVLTATLEYFDYSTREAIQEELYCLEPLFDDFDPSILQKVWCKKLEGLHPFEIIDQLGKVVEKLVARFFTEPSEQFSELTHVILQEEVNQKLARHSNLIIAGFIVGSWGNLLIANKKPANKLTI
ncbi:MAG: DNA (cytosine-5-)-methyltransferase [Lewinellaceae bacterium]|nr:DNA (cytosine-5-)-methyltransferase [Lewinellaceae bacterium]